LNDSKVAFGIFITMPIGLIICMNCGLLQGSNPDGLINLYIIIQLHKIFPEVVWFHFYEICESN